MCLTSTFRAVEVTSGWFQRHHNVGLIFRHWRCFLHQQLSAEALVLTSLSSHTDVWHQALRSCLSRQEIELINSVIYAGKQWRGGVFQPARCSCKIWVPEVRGCVPILYCTLILYYYTNNMYYIQNNCALFGQLGYIKIMYFIILHSTRKMFFHVFIIHCFVFWDVPWVVASVSTLCLHFYFLHLHCAMHCGTIASINTTFNNQVTSVCILAIHNHLLAWMNYTLRNIVRISV